MMRLCSHGTPVNRVCDSCNSLVFSSRSYLPPAIRCPICGSLDIDIDGKCRAVHTGVKEEVDAVMTAYRSATSIGSFPSARRETLKALHLEMMLNKVVQSIDPVKYGNLIAEIIATVGVE